MHVFINNMKQVLVHMGRRGADCYFIILFYMVRIPYLNIPKYMYIIMFHE